MLNATDIAAGKQSPSEALEASLRAIDALEPKLQAWVEVDRDGASKAASTRPQGALAGVPIGVKDIVDVAGLPTRLGAAEFAHSQPEKDAVAVARLRAAGAVILGKTHTTQFAYMDPAPTFNPWHPERTPGGSSSGSAAAVAAGMVPLAIGSQTVGSVLRPAAYCGIVGLKPSYGRIPYGGTAHLAPSFDHLGVLCGSVADAALGLSVLAGDEPGDPAVTGVATEDYIAAAASPSAPRIGLARQFYEAEAVDEVKRHLDSVAQSLRSTGAELLEVDLSLTAREAADMGQPVLRSEAALVHASYFDANKNSYRPGIRALIESGQKVPEADVLHSRKALAVLRSQVCDVLANCDVLLMPVAPATAPDRETTGNSVFCALASFTGLPSIALPSGIAEDGLPLSIQLVAAPFAEAKLLAAAAWVERVLDFKARPPLHA